MWNYDGSSTGQVSRQPGTPRRSQGQAKTLPVLPGAALLQSVTPLPTIHLCPRSGQAPGDDSEVYLVPRAIYRDPFRGGDNILVM